MEEPEIILDHLLQAELAVATGAEHIDHQRAIIAGLER
jgi:hypothetical protein